MSPLGAAAAGVGIGAGGVLALVLMISLLIPPLMWFAAKLMPLYIAYANWFS